MPCPSHTAGHMSQFPSVLAIGLPSPPLLGSSLDPEMMEAADPLGKGKSWVLSLLGLTTQGARFVNESEKTTVLGVSGVMDRILD